MRLADFIETHLQSVMAEWEAFALTRLPSAEKMDSLALRDHAEQILQAIATDLREPQSDAAQLVKSRGLAPLVQGLPHTAAEIHGALRARDGFSIAQLVSEFRALRASVLRLWAEAGGLTGDASATDDVMRFNEAVDQAIAESVDFFSREFTQERTSREGVERELLLNRARLEYASRLSRVGFWYCDLPFDLLEWDDQVKEHFFIEPTARVTIEDFYDRIHPEDRDLTRESIDASVASREAYDVVYRTRSPSTGEVKWIRALGGTDYAADGTPMHFDGITVDVTAQKLEEKRVADSEARHRGVLTNTDESFTLFDPEFNLVEVNDAACKLIGLARKELIGYSHWQLFPGTYESELGQMYRQVLADAHPRGLEHLYVFADGRRVWFDTRAFKVGDSVAVLYRDVTHRREMIDALRDADKRKDEFLAMLAHELRNPLAPITTASEILSRPTNSKSTIKSATGVIRRQAKHMTRLIDDLLDVSRITQGRIHLQKAPTDIAAVISQAFESCESQLASKQQHLTISIDKTIPLIVQGDFARLVQCVGNILVNAIKYTDAHGAIEVNACSEEGTVVIKITDTGGGIAPELLPRIFDLFVQSDRTLDRAQGGLGVGLAVVRRLVDMHGGQVKASSEGEGEGKGSTFEIRLPRIASASAGVESMIEVKSVSKRVLVVDDNVDAAETLLMLLEMQGHVPMAVHTANEALARIGGFKPDVILIDIGLPDIDGYEFVQRLCEGATHSKLRKIALTGYGQPEDKQRALDVGFDEHLIKPVDLHILERAIAGVSQ